MSRGQAGVFAAEIEVTPEMMRAGEIAFEHAWNSSAMDPGPLPECSDFIHSVYIAMRQLEPDLRP